MHNSPPKLKKFPASKHRRLDVLLEQDSEGTTTAKELAVRKSLVADAGALMVKNAQHLAKFAHSQSSQAPVNAVPVTVWVNPQLAQ